MEGAEGSGKEPDDVSAQDRAPALEVCTQQRRPTRTRLPQGSFPVGCAG